MVVLCQPEGAILLLNEEDRGDHGQLRRVNSTRLKVLLEEGIQLILLLWHKWVDLAV